MYLNRLTSVKVIVKESPRTDNDLAEGNCLLYSHYCIPYYIPKNSFENVNLHFRMDFLNFYERCMSKNVGNKFSYRGMVQVQGPPAYCASWAF